MAREQMIRHQGSVNNTTTDTTQPLQWLKLESIIISSVIGWRTTRPLLHCWLEYKAVKSFWKTV